MSIVWRMNRDFAVTYFLLFGGALAFDIALVAYAGRELPLAFYVFLTIIAVFYAGQRSARRMSTPLLGATYWKVAIHLTLVAFCIEAVLQIGALSVHPVTPDLVRLFDMIESIPPLAWMVIISIFLVTHLLCIRLLLPFAVRSGLKRRHTQEH